MLSRGCASTHLLLKPSCFWSTALSSSPLLLPLLSSPLLSVLIVRVYIWYICTCAFVCFCVWICLELMLHREHAHIAELQAIRQAISKAAAVGSAQSTSKKLFLTDLTDLAVSQQHPSQIPVAPVHIVPVCSNFKPFQTCPRDSSWRLLWVQWQQFEAKPWKGKHGKPIWKTLFHIVEPWPLRWQCLEPSTPRQQK